uniref:ADP-ribosylation factor-like protein 2-binding protein n=1 Tax=Vombatus ursinus TaxID=29139 RepID=A0A4X2LEM8_VOMUR
MDTLEENFALATSSTSEAEFDAVVGCIEDVVMDGEFHCLRIPGFNMATFTTTFQRHKDEVAGDILVLLLTFTDFLAFKEMFLDYRAEKEGRSLDLSSGLMVTSLCKSSSIPASQNNLRH